MNIRELNSLMTSHDIKNRLPRGRRSVNEGLVHQVKSMVDPQYDSLDIYGKVMSSESREMYSTNISIDIKNLKLIYTECDCIDYKDNADFNSNYICKHVAATFYRFIDILEERLKEESRGQGLSARKIDMDYSKKLLDQLDEDDNKREMLNIEVSLEKKSYFRGEPFFEADFKIGSNHLYVMKNIPEFVKARINEEKLIYGKNFIYDPKRHYFSDEDERIIDFIEEYAGLNEALGSGPLYGRTSSGPISKNKMLVIPSQTLRRFLECLSHKRITFIEKDEEKKIKIKKEDMPLKFKLEEDHDSINLSISNNLPRPLTYKSDVYIYDDVVYLPSKKQAQKYKLFYSALKDNEKISFKGEKKKDVFTKIIPALDIITKEVNLDDNLKKNIVKEDLKIQVFFDRDKKSTWADVKMNYGEESFNLAKGPNNEQYIIRDLNKEQNIENVLNRHSFYRDKGKFIFNGDDDKLYEFLLSDLKDVKECGEVFYSDRFKDRKIYGSTSMKGSIKKDGNSNFLEFTFEVEEVDKAEFADILRAFKEKRKFYKLKNDSFVNFADEKVKDFFTLAETLSLDNNMDENRIRIHRNRAAFINEAIESGNMSYIDGKEIVSHISNKLKTIKEVNYSIPAKLNAKLRDYQITGYNWFKTLSHYEFGGILADEMGLGKTIQTITFLLSEKENNKKSLIVTPTSLIYNWKSEFENFAPSMRIAVLHGSKEERIEIMENIESYDVILTTYGTLKNDYEWYNDKEFDYCIIDEAQHIKNPQSISSETVKEIKAKVKFALTGTPIENNLLELWSIFDFVMPGYLYNKNRFQERFIGTREGTVALKKMIQPFILRRLKKNVMMELPDKIEKKYYVEMNEEQKKVYSSYIADIKEKMNDKDINKDKITIFSYLTKLRQLCLDPSVIVEGYNGGSSKIDTALSIVCDAIDAERKILLFSQFTSVLDNIKKTLKENNIDYYYLDGATKAQERIKLVNDFNSKDDVSVFLISLKAGGTGLNLTSADMVIHFDPWWNPAIEDQATDRAHRFGQKSNVEVIKLIAKGTIEEKIIKLQDDKKEVIGEVMNGDYKNGSLLGTLSEEKIKELFL